MLYYLRCHFSESGPIYLTNRGFDQATINMDLNFWPKILPALERFPINGPGGEPNYRRVDHRDLLLEGEQHE